MQYLNYLYENNMLRYDSIALTFLVFYILLRIKINSS
jgi:hypothetical protein